MTPLLEVRWHYFPSLGPPGLRAKEVIEINGDAIESKVKLASGDGPFEDCVLLKLTRAGEEKQK